MTITETNNRIEKALSNVHNEWLVAFQGIIAKTGKRKGLLLKTCPGYAADKFGTKRVLWNAYNDTLCELRAGQFGFTPNRSYGGTINAAIMCDRVDCLEAYTAMQTIMFRIATDHARAR